MGSRAPFLLFCMLLSTPAFGYKVADFDCCHLRAPLLKATHPLTIRILPLADVRDTGAPPDEQARHAGIVRGGYANSFKVLAKKPVLEYLTEAFAEHLRALGHTVVLGGEAPADLTIRGEVRALDFDVSSFGTYKQHGAVSLVLEGRGAPVQIDLSVENHDTTGAGLGVSPALKRRAREWYGHGGMKWAFAAALEDLIVELTLQLSDGSHGGPVLVAGEP